MNSKWVRFGAEMCLGNFDWVGDVQIKVINYIFFTNYFYIANIFNSISYKDNAQEAIYNDMD